MTRRPRLFSLEREVPLARSMVWRLLSHTDQLNRAIGLPAVHFDPAADDPTLYREARARLYGMPVRWKEYPFEWVREVRYAVTRVYDEGPIARIDGAVELADASTSSDSGIEHAGTRLRLTAEVTPASVLGALITPFIARNFLNRTLQYCRSFASHGRAADFDPPPPAPGSPANAAELERLLTTLRSEPRLPGSCTGYIEKLGKHLRERGDSEVASIRPYQLAAQWDAEPDDLLRLCLYATRHGLLNLSWNVMCPNCRAPKVESASLAEVTDQLHCDLCGVSYETNFDRYVELRFAVHPAIRQATEQTYCIGGPFTAPHILVQQPIAAGASVTVSCPGAAEPLRLRVVRSNDVLEFDDEPATDSASVADIHYTETGWTPKQCGPPRAGNAIRLENRSGQDILVALEKIEWDPLAVTAARVTSMQEFRDMFSSEVLAPGQHVGIENLTLIFTDLRDSTQLYERVGDAPAYGRVRRHFDFLGGFISANRGSIVKTIGDAVMASFYTPEDAVRAAVQIQQNVAEFNATLGSDDGIVIKLGLHHGPAVAVNSNDRLDYFGRTVNIAARIGAVSTGNDIVMSAHCHDREGVREIIDEAGLSGKGFESSLKGIEEIFELYRVRF